MTPELPTVNGQQQPGAAAPAGGVVGDLAEVQAHTIELLRRLDRPPRNLRIRAGTVTVEITWADQPAAPATGAAEPGADRPARPEPPDTGAAGAAAAAEDVLASPGVGVFYHAPEPGAEPFVTVGSVVQPGQQIGIIEAMKLMVPVEADRSGRITCILKADGERVEYGEPLFALEAEDGSG